jgi:hypothetical protein
MPTPAQDWCKTAHNLEPPRRQDRERHCRLDARVPEAGSLRVDARHLGEDWNGLGASGGHVAQCSTTFERTGKTNALDERVFYQGFAYATAINHVETPAGMPLRSAARMIALATCSAVARWPLWALNITGQPAASAEAVSPPAVEKAHILETRLRGQLRLDKANSSRFDLSGDACILLERRSSTNNVAHTHLIVKDKSRKI